MEINLPKLIEQFGSEDRCRDYLEELRWPDGVHCPRCGSTKISRIQKRHQFDCDSCRYQFSVTAGTLFHDSHLPLWKWFLAVYLIAESKKGISAKQLQRTLGVSYKTAWYLGHRIRAAMGDEDERPLAGIVEVDETFIGGRKWGMGKGGAARLHPLVVGAAERGGEIRLKIAGNRSKRELHGFIRSHVSDETEAIYTDNWLSYKGIGDKNTRHETVNHMANEYVRADVHTNTVENVWSLFKRSIVGSYHQLSVKHLPAYLDEMEFRFNNRDNPYLFRDTLLVLLCGDAMPYSELVDR